MALLPDNGRRRKGRGERSFNAEVDQHFPHSHRKLTVLFPRLELVGGKVPCPHPEEESSALLPAKGRQIKAACGTRQPCKEIEEFAMGTDVTRQT